MDDRTSNVFDQTVPSHSDTSGLWTIQERLESYSAISVSWLASAAFLQEQQSVTVLLGLKTQAVNATDEAYSVMRVAVHINGWHREANRSYKMMFRLLLITWKLNCTGRVMKVGWKRQAAVNN